MSAFLALSMLAVDLASLPPYDLRKGSRCIALYYPFVSVALYIAYEAAIASEIPSSSVPIRVDLAVIHPVLMFSIMIGITRWALAIRLRERCHTGAQLLAGTVFGMACLLWFCLQWL